MIYCTKCGAANQDGLTFCTKCGGVLPQSQPVQAQPAPYEPAKEPISIGGWIGRSLIPCIPIVGGIVYLIMLFIWSGDKTKEETFNNWAKAQLIVMGIVIVLTIILAVAFGSAIADLANYY